MFCVLSYQKPDYKLLPLPLVKQIKYMNDNMPKNEEEFKKKLTPEQYEVLRQKGTEPAFSGKLIHPDKDGFYKCAACGNPLFKAEAKFDSGTGWPSFDEPMNLKNIELKKDDSGGVARTEVICKNCGSHLGHVFDDLPAGRQAVRQDGKVATKRYCINSICLGFEEANQKNI